MSAPSALLGLMLSVAAADGVAAQLISPGRLSEAHAELEGIRRCTECHELGRAGSSDTKCLACHEPLRTRIGRREGWHPSVADRDCAECHKEHLGREFDVVRLDTVTFDHATTGYRLAGAHASTSCRSCHRRDRIAAADVRAWGARHGSLDRTLLGLPESCASCHRDDDPHAGQFGRRACETCHDEREWESAPRLDHADTRYPLTGEHARVACGECHRAGRDGAVRWSGVPAGSCATCHDDPHTGTMGTRCESCHGTTGWGRVDRAAVERRFDHDRTGFTLVGAHARAECTTCHTAQPRRTEWLALRIERGTENRTYPRPASGTCAACHADWHHGAFRDETSGGACDACHGQEAWLPAVWGVEDHGRTRYPLEGAHVATPCDACHSAAEGARRFTIENRSCAACHGAQDPHGDRYMGLTCESCHAPAGFAEGAFDHERAPAAASCASCHEPDDPHAGQFAEPACGACHTTTSFREATFDHDRASFRLDGAHRAAACAACHRTELRADGRAFVRYRPVSADCAACHGGPR